MLKLIVIIAILGGDRSGTAISQEIWGTYTKATCERLKKEVENERTFYYKDERYATFTEIRKVKCIPNDGE